jgi:hypothetical protein
MGSICYDAVKYKCLVSEIITFTSSARKMIISYREKYRERL